MKAKLKGANGFVRFLLNHGEKIGIAAILLMAGMLIFKSMGREKLGADKQPDKLAEKVKQAENHFQHEMNWDNFDPANRTDHLQFQQRPGEVVISPVSRENFPPVTDWDPPAVPPIKPRTDPQLLAPEKLEVHGQSGLWMTGDPDVVREKMKKAYEQYEAEQLKLEKEREKAAAQDAERGGRGGRGGPEGGFGGPEGRGMYSGMGAMGNFGGEKTKDGAIVVQPRTGAQMQGFEDIRNVSWVTVVAKVPYKQQVQMYEDALLNSRGFNQQNDTPQYYGYIVERAEITDDGAGAWQRIDAVTGESLLKRMSPVQTPDLVKPNYIHPLLTYPLPPMIIRQWDERITHSEMPLPTPEELARGFVEETPVEETKKDEANPNDPFGGSALKRTPQNQMYGGEGPMRGGMYGGRGGPMGGMYGRGGPEGGMGRMGAPMMYGRGGPEGGPEGRGMMGGMGGGFSMQSELPPFTWDSRTEFILFRYFDSKVEPGHKYKYRVKLGLFDVNAQQPPSNLDKEVADRLAKEKAASKDKPPRPLGWRLSEWSEESPVAVVPQPGLSFVSTVKNSSNPLAEPEAKMVVKSLDAANAAEIALSDYFTRGAVMNLSRKAQVIWSSLFKATDNNGQPVESPQFDFLTGTTLLDFEGGEPLAKRRDLTAPARALIMDSAGRMTIQSELEDKKSIREFEFILDAAAKAKALERQQRQDERRGGGRGGR